CSEPACAQASPSPSWRLAWAPASQRSPGSKAARRCQAPRRCCAMRKRPAASSTCDYRRPDAALCDARRLALLLYDSGRVVSAPCIPLGLAQHPLDGAIAPNSAKRKFFSELRYFCLTEIWKQAYSPPRPASSEGRFAVVTERWVRDAMDAFAPKANGAEADGKGVCSWHPDAGVKFWVMIPGRRWLSSPVPRGERAISRKPLAQGVPAVSAALSLLACAKCTFLCTQGSRVRPASGAPCALDSIEGQ